MSGTELWRAPIESLAPRIADGQIDSVELFDCYAERIARLDGRLGAYVALNGLARKTAETARDEIRAGRYRGPLHGIPIAVKDNYTTSDMPTRAGQVAVKNEYPMVDGAAVARLRAAGAVLIGKTRMHEFAWGMETPPARNPWDEARTPGGSSGGSGVAMAAGLAAGALGSDTGGSIRIPASLCGCVGFKPTFGLIGRSGIIPHSWSLDTAGPLASSVRDAALIASVMSGPDIADPGATGQILSIDTDVVNAGVDGMTIGLCRNHFFESLDEDVALSVEKRIEGLAAAGARIVEFSLPELACGLGAIFAIELASSTSYHALRLRDGRSEAMAPDVRLLVEMGRLVSAADYLHAERYRRTLCQRMAQVFSEVDIVLTPTSPLTAWPTGQSEVMLAGRRESALAASWRFTYPWNLIGAPAISLPCGKDRRGLPIGLQLVAAPQDDITALRCAAIVEAQLGGSALKIG